MREMVINKENGTDIYLNYDEKNYLIEYVKNKHMIALKDCFTNSILEIFTDEIGFLVQYNEGDVVNFIVTEYQEEDETIKLKHFVDDGNCEELIFKREFDCNAADIDSCRITDSSFFVEQSGNSSCIYNLNEKSKRYDSIYKDDRISKMFGDDNILMVNEKEYAFYNFNISDTITYGINPETFEIVTPIWSELQQRFIDLYTEKQAEDAIKKCEMSVSVSNYNLADITIAYEIQKYLNKLDNYFDKPQKVYLDSFGDKINEPFVKKFIKK